MDFSPRVTVIHIDYIPIIELITAISDIHKKFSDEYLERFSSRLKNLKKQLVRDAFEDGLNIVNEDYYSLIQNYHEMLRAFIVETELEYEYADLDLRIRIKQTESIMHKLIYYKTGRSEEGKVPINKCLNDLLGFRIFIDGFDHNCNKLNDLCQTLNAKYSIKDRSNGNYRGTHVYFYSDNKAFPWELQIWNKADESTNEQSHKTHKSKREYIKWPNTYKNSKTY
ncbi:hypothetical protein ABNB59_22105 [Paenibacillus larvae]|uniref:GTP pyrophosphokinase-like protein n=7 Tax=Caudoviricetes TaxID=2731619 RepID=A0A0C5AN10_9CAUD|nr:hypothetical protein [Paenibacillus larvae]YP_009202237.1 GTP pyrophosphokinase-like protein [Bacteriophage Lily]YP_009838926.1 putative GTP pyrophosphokinase [Paenibacillus phage Jacopo]AXF40038.1 putative GTP pyrophosphokinase [Paenibacillus phage Bloom]AXF40397.1 putative GTP pyrophosphokinase [Paenibacillus phage Genki]AXF42265.1 putative GTP pyrophosphokinase [Paenibacillus phage Gryphonian]AXH45285.1 putative GTP pyrophosphokinase [Paenibacillus phage Arcticfreeze]AXH45351.1 putativ